MCWACLAKGNRQAEQGMPKGRQPASQHMAGAVDSRELSPAIPARIPLTPITQAA